MVVGLYMDNGKENGNHYSGFRVWGFGGFPKLGVPNGATMVPNVTPIMENQMEKKMENEMKAGII